jgi:hypothetical protein
MDGDIFKRFRPVLRAQRWIESPRSRFEDAHLSKAYH